MKKDIAILLPYKENYAVGYAAAASLWVYDFLKYSKYKSINSRDVYIIGKRR